MSAYVVESSHFYGHTSTEVIYLGQEDNIVSIRGKLGIDVASPAASIHIATTDSRALRFSRTGANDFGFEIGGTTYGLYDYTTGQYKWRTNSGNVLLAEVSGSVGIGTSSPGEKLEVNGNALIDGEIYSKKVKVSTNPGGWPDYVFEPNYELKPLSEVETYIQTHKHLPEVPSAKEVEAKGLDLGSMDATLLKKLEEMTLYLIEMKKEINALKKENEELKKAIDK